MVVWDPMVLEELRALPRVHRRPPMLLAPRALRDRVCAIWSVLLQDAVQAQEEECANVLLSRGGQLLLRVPQEVGCVAEGCPEGALHDSWVDGEDVVGITAGRGRQGHRSFASAVAASHGRQRCLGPVGAYGVHGCVCSVEERQLWLRYVWRSARCCVGR